MKTISMPLDEYNKEIEDLKDGNHQASIDKGMLIILGILQSGLMHGLHNKVSKFDNQEVNKEFNKTLDLILNTRRMFP